MNDKVKALVRLSHEIGSEDHHLVILGEGSASTKVSSDQFAIRASGRSLGTLKEQEVTICDTAKALALLERKGLSDEAVEEQLLDLRVDATSAKPGLEAVFHAWLLNLREVNFVGHCQAVPINQVLCSPRARDFAERRLFPDEIGSCGAESVFVPFVDPGLVLAREIAERTRTFMEKEGYTPRLIVLQNHGVIAIGPTASSVMNCLLMAAKAAAVFMGAAAMGGPNFLTQPHVDRLAQRPENISRGVR
jgi:rhamnose utilization protein RhaD (predicted bifunctional aldolase and dehydrogenase)